MQADQADMQVSPEILRAVGDVSVESTITRLSPRTRFAVDLTKSWPCLVTESEGSSGPSAMLDWEKVQCHVGP